MFLGQSSLKLQRGPSRAPGPWVCRVIHQHEQAGDNGVKLLLKDGAESVDI